MYIPAFCDVRRVHVEMRFRVLPAGWNLILVAMMLIAGCSSEAQPVRQDEGTVRMAGVLTRIRESMPTSSEYENLRRAESLRLVPEGETPLDRLRRENLLSIELLQGGRTEEAIELIEDMRRRVEEWPGEERPRMLEAVRRMQALAYLRLGEQENCLLHHAPESCILPIATAAVHRLPRGSQRAAAEYQAMLDEIDPENLGWRWLLNLAHMTLGSYPASVPGKYLIPPTAFAAEYDVGRFPNIAAALGIDVNGSAGGVAAEDFDRDGDLDIVVSSWNLNDQVRYFVNQGDGTFSDHTARAGLTGIVGGLNLVHADYNNDGYADVLVLRGAWYGRNGNQPNSLLRNNGDGTFSDVTFEAGIFSQRPTQTAAWADFDGDGWLDLFIGNESTSGNPHPSELYRNQGDGTFIEVSAEVGLQVRVYAKGVAWGDVDNDNRPDLYISTFEGPNLLFHNEGPDASGRWRFRNIAAAAGVEGPERSFPTWFFDFDNDGWQDIFVSGYQTDVSDIAAEYLGRPHKGAFPRLYRNRGDGTFEDVAGSVDLHRIMLTMGCNFGDIDNDGYLDFYVGTGNPDLRNLMPNRLFRNDGGTRFQEITTSAGVGHLQKGHGVAFADFDHDGALDIYAVIGGAYEGDVYRNVLFHNPGQEGGFVGLHLEGTRSNRAAIGARIRAQFVENGTVRTVHRTVTTGSSFGSNPFRVHLGIGSAASIDEVEILWPSGERQTIRQLERNADYRITEGEARPEKLTRHHIALRTDSPTTHVH